MRVVRLEYAKHMAIQEHIWYLEQKGQLCRARGNMVQDEVKRQDNARSGHDMDFNFHSESTETIGEFSGE